MGCCVPNEILDYLGKYWLKRQKRIQSVSLITDGRCPTFSYVEYVDLNLFIDMQSLSWKGLNRGDRFDSLKNFIKLQTGARRLRSLTLDLIKWTWAESGWYAHQRATIGGYPHSPENFFATGILGIKPGRELHVFESLKSLRLVGVAFSPFENELVYAFNMTNLSTLQLRNCPASLELLHTILNKDITVKLKSFELAIDWDCLHHYGDFEDLHAEVIFRFLASFQGLEDLFLMLPPNP